MKRGITTLVTVNSITILTAAGLAIGAPAKSPLTARACVKGNGALALLRGGHCPANSSKIRLNERGPRGRRGAVGPQGPGALQIAQTSTPTSHPTSSVTVPGTDVKVGVSCGASQGNDFFGVDSSGDDELYVEGTYASNTDQTHDAVFPDGAVSDTLIDARAVSSWDVTVHGESDKGATFTADPTVLLDGKTVFTVNVSLRVTANGCNNAIQVVPSTG
jgi:hypothetical protein